MGRLDTKERKALPSKDFAGPGRSYPINDPNHARNALSRVSQNGSPEVKAEVRSKVHAKYPNIGSGSEQGTEGVQRETDMGSMLKSALGKKKK
jgi:hypothetical protein